MLPNKKFWKNKKIFLTGDTSFKGSWLKFWLNYLGAKVEGYSLDLPSKPYSNYKSLFGIKFKKGNINNISLLKKRIKNYNPEIVFHFAAQTILSEAKKKPLENFKTNIIGTANLIESCLKIKKIKLIVIVTSDKCYKENNFLKYYTENSKIGGSEPYSASKACAEILVDSYKNQIKLFNKKIITVRAGNVIGGGDWKKDRLLPDIFKSFIFNRKIIIRNKNHIRPWQHVLDCLNGYLLASEFSYSNKRYVDSWNFAPPMKGQKRVNYLLKLIRSKILLNVKNIIFKKNNFFYESKRLNLNSFKAKKELNWMCHLNINQAISFTCDWYNEFKNQANIKNFAIKQLKEYSKIVTSKRKKIKK